MVILLAGYSRAFAAGFASYRFSQNHVILLIKRAFDTHGNSLYRDNLMTR
jgi:hypothetical protein